MFNFLVPNDHRNETFNCIRKLSLFFPFYEPAASKNPFSFPNSSPVLHLRALFAVKVESGGLVVKPEPPKSQTLACSFFSATSPLPR